MAIDLAPRLIVGGAPVGERFTDKDYHAALFRNGAKSIVLAVNGDIKGGSVTIPSKLFHKQSLEVEALE